MEVLALQEVPGGQAMSARTVLRYLSGAFLTLGAMGLLGRFLDSNWPVTLTAPLTMLVLGFTGVLALFLKGEQP